MIDLTGKTAVVTGGASGIGLGAANAFRRAGADVFVGDLAVSNVGSDLSFVQCDVRSESDIEALHKAATAHGSVDIVMANAGIAAGGRFEYVPIEQWEQILDINVTGVARTIKAFLPGMIERGGGTIVVTGSSAGLFVSDGGDIPYAATKYALHGMALGLANYCQSFGINVHYLAPRITDTPFPTSAKAWGRRGLRITEDRDVSGADTVDTVVAALMAALEENRFLVSLTPGTRDKMVAYASDPEPSKHVRQRS